MTPQDHNIAEKILSGAQPDRPAVCSGDKVLTYGQIRAAAYGLAGRLIEHGFAAGDRIGLHAENSPFFIAAYLGVIRAGLCVVPFPVDCSEKTLERMALATGMKLVLISARFWPRVEPVARRLDIKLEDESSLLPNWPAGPASPDTQCSFPAIDPRRDLAAIMLTSGSTGESKGVMVTHRNIECNTRDIIQYLGLGPGERTMTVLPFYYCYGTSLMHTHLMAGGSLVLNNRFMFPEKVLDEMAEKKCTGFAGVPSTYQILLRHTNFARRKFPALRWLQQAGGKLPNPFIQEIRRAFPGVRLYVMYGQTEATARLSYLPPELLDDKLGSIGKGLPGSRLEVLKEDGTPVRPGSDEIGEIAASGDNIAPGYWNDAEETARFFRNGRLFTGDMARVDRDGFIFIVERTRDFIKAMGNRVSPKEIEEVLSQMPDVVEAAVIGVPHEIWGEAIKAYLTTNKPGQLTVEDVRNYCLGQLPNYKVPEYIEFLPQLPKTANGKVAKEVLRKMAGNKLY
ncbi:MAG: AMP-binding protein [Thermoguttaceae bacterium]